MLQKNQSPIHEITAKGLNLSLIKAKDLIDSIIDVMAEDENIAKLYDILVDIVAIF